MERRKILGSAAGVLLVFGGAVVAGQEPALESTLARRATALAARAALDSGSVPVLGAPSVLVVGFVWKGDDTPVEHPVLRIRNLQDGQVAARTTGSVLGEFRFDRLDGGSYLIELLDPDDRILAVGQPLFVLPGEAVGTFIRLSTEGGSIDSRFDVLITGDSSAYERSDVLSTEGSSVDGRVDVTSSGLFRGSAPAVIHAADDARVTAVGGRNAASNER